MSIFDSFLKVFPISELTFEKLHVVCNFAVTNLNHFQGGIAGPTMPILSLRLRPSGWRTRAFRQLSPKFGRGGVVRSWRTQAGALARDRRSMTTLANANSQKVQGNRQQRREEAMRLGLPRTYWCQLGRRARSAVVKRPRRTRNSMRPSDSSFEWVVVVVLFVLTHGQYSPFEAGACFGKCVPPHV